MFLNNKLQTLAAVVHKNKKKKKETLYTGRGVKHTLLTLNDSLYSQHLRKIVGSEFCKTVCNQSSSNIIQSIWTIVQFQAMTGWMYTFALT